MKSVSMVETSDGQLHKDVHAAQRHADRRYGDAVNRLARGVVALDWKYLKVIDFIDENIEAFAELKALKADLETLHSEDGETTVLRPIGDQKHTRGRLRRP